MHAVCPLHACGVPIACMRCAHCTHSQSRAACAVVYHSWAGILASTRQTTETGVALASQRAAFRNMHTAPAVVGRVGTGWDRVLCVNMHACGHASGRVDVCHGCVFVPRSCHVTEGRCTCLFANGRIATRPLDCADVYCMLWVHISTHVHRTYYTRGTYMRVLSSACRVRVVCVAIVRTSSRSLAIWSVVSTASGDSMRYGSICWMDTSMLDSRICDSLVMIWNDRTLSAVLYAAKRTSQCCPSIRFSAASSRGSTHCVVYTATCMHTRTHAQSNATSSNASRPTYDMQ